MQHIPSATRRPVIIHYFLPIYFRERRLYGTSLVCTFSITHRGNHRCAILTVLKASIKIILSILHYSGEFSEKFSAQNYQHQQCKLRANSLIYFHLSPSIYISFFQSEMNRFFLHSLPLQSHKNRQVTIHKAQRLFYSLSQTLN